MKNKKVKVFVRYDKRDYNDNENQIIKDQLKRIKKINEKLEFAMNVKVKTSTHVKIEEGPFYLQI